MDYDALRDQVIDVTYRNMTMRQMVQAIVNEWLPSVRIGRIPEGPTLSIMVFKWRTPFECFDELACIAGCTWELEGRTLNFTPMTEEEIRRQNDKIREYMRSLLSD